MREKKKERGLTFTSRSEKKLNRRIDGREPGCLRRRETERERRSLV